MNNKILIIEDSAVIRENIAEFLEIAGFNIVTAENGKTGMAKTIAEKPDLIICDIMMPELDGYGLLHLLQKSDETKHIPFIFLTAKSDKEDFRRGMEMGADDYITKPFSQVELLNAVENRLRKVNVIEQHYASSHPGMPGINNDEKSGVMVEDLNTQYETHSFAKKQVLYQQGKRPRNLYYLLRGKVKTYRINDEGKEYITNFYTAEDFLGYNSLLEDSLYDSTAVIMEESEIMLIPKEDFLKMIYNDATVCSKFIKLISKNEKEKEERLLNLAYSSLRKRIATSIVDISNKFRGDTESDVIDMTREDLAHFVGTTTESLIRTVTDFKHEGLIEIDNGKIKIVNKLKLERMLN